MSPTISEWTARATAVADAIGPDVPGPFHRAMIRVLMAAWENGVLEQMLDLAAAVPWNFDAQDRVAPAPALSFLTEALDAPRRRVKQPDPARYQPLPPVVADALAARYRLVPPPPPDPISPRYTGELPWCPMCSDSMMECPHDPVARDEARSKISPAYFARFGLI